MNEKIIKIMSLVLQISPSGTPAEKDKPIAAAMYHGAVKILDASVRQQNKTLIEEMIYCDNVGIGAEKQLDETIEQLEKILKGDFLNGKN